MSVDSGNEHIVPGVVTGFQGDIGVVIIAVHLYCKSALFEVVQT